MFVIVKCGHLVSDTISGKCHKVPFLISPLSWTPPDCWECLVLVGGPTELTVCVSDFILWSCPEALSSAHVDLPRAG